jgi:hypothetical protein
MKLLLHALAHSSNINGDHLHFSRYANVGTTKKLSTRYSVVKGRLLDHGYYYIDKKCFVNRRVFFSFKS